MKPRPTQLRFDALMLPLQLVFRHSATPGIAAALVVQITRFNRTRAVSAITIAVLPREPVGLHVEQQAARLAPYSGCMQAVW